MKKTTKKILGLVGLATVAALTLLATGINNPANATGASVSGNVTLQYVVIDEGKTNVVIESPANQSKTSSSIIPVQVIYGGTTTIKYSLTYTVPGGAPGQTVTIPLLEYPTPVYEGGVHEWSFNLADYNLGYGTYILNVECFGNGTASDSVEFTYQPITLEPTPGSGTTTDESGNIVTDENGTIDADIHHSSGVDHATITVLNSDGTPYVDPITGNSVTFPISSEDLQYGRIKLDLSQYGFTNGGKYIFSIDSYTANNEFIGTVVYPFIYSVASADVPNTGGSLFAGLNISNSDFLASSLLIFGLVTVGAFVIIRKSNKDRRR